MLAKKGANKTQPYSTAKQVILAKSQMVWLDRWARGTTGRTLYQHQKSPNQTDPINQLHRSQQSAIFRLRTQHTTLNAHLHRIKKDHSAACVYCPDSDETTDHFLLYCLQYNDIRTRLLPPDPTIDNTLYGPTTQHQKTASFYKSAMNKRNITVRSLKDQER